MPITHGSLFSGIGGFDLAATWLGWLNAFNCERDPFCSHILKEYWPTTTHYEDVKTFDGKKYANQITVLSGGFPCQPFSIAGKRRGSADDRYLWPQMLRITDEIRPRWVVGENVFGLINWERGLVFRKVLTQLETQGYDVWPYVLPACGVGAPHLRQRIFFVGCQKGKFEKFLNDPAKRRQLFTTPQDLSTRSTSPAKYIAPNSHGDKRRKGRMYPAGSQAPERHPSTLLARDIRDPWQNFPSQSPLSGGDDGLSNRLDGITFSKWRKESIKAYGNAVVPQLAYQIFKAIESLERLTTQK